MQKEQSTLPEEKAKDQKVTFQMYLVKVPILRHKYKPQVINVIVRTAKYSDIRPAIEKLLRGQLEKLNAWVGKIDARKLHHDAIIWDTDGLLSE